MPFDPALPAADDVLSSEVLRGQFTALRALIDTIPVGPQGPAGEVTAEQLLEERLQHARNPAGLVAPLGLTVSATPTQAEVQSIATKLDELIAALQRLALPTAPQNVVVVSGAAGSGAASIGADAPPVEEGVTSWRIFRDGVQIADVTVLPANFDGFTPGEALNITMSAVNAAGEGPQCAVVTGTAG